MNTFHESAIPLETPENQFTDLSSEQIRAQLSPEQQKAILLDMINELPEGRKDYDVFLALAEKMVLTCIEVTPLRTNPETGKTEVLLTQRPDGDQWAGQWHVPGAVILSSDDANASPEEGGPYKDAIERVLGGELSNSLQPIGAPQEIRTEFRDTPRSKELTVVTYVEVEGEPTTGVFVPVEDIEKNSNNIIEHQVQFIIDCAHDYEAKKASQKQVA